MKNIAYRALCFGLAVLSLLLVSGRPVEAASDKSDLQAIITLTQYYKERFSCSQSGGDQQLVPGQETPKWVTSLSPPYSLEDFAVETLRALAKKMNVPETNTVTQEHVLFFVAYAHREGGNLTNNSLYNPWNTGYSGADLKPVKHDTAGAQAYTSFNDGVEAYARVFSGTGGSSGYQSRMGTVFSKAETTSADLAKAITYYKPYPGNLAWASASEEPNAAKFMLSVLNSIEVVKSHYANEASYLMGEPGHTADKNLHSPHPLRYSFSGDSTTNPGNASSDDSSSCAKPQGSADCATADGSAQSIVGCALSFSWPENRGLDKKPEYLAAMRQFNPGIPFGGADAREGGADCGGFVATVMRASGADPNYPTAGTGNQENYVRRHPEKYDIVDKVGSTAELQPGDILIVNRGGGAGADGHTYLFVGPQPNGTNAASASFHKRMANLGNAILSDYRGSYMRARLK